MSWTHSELIERYKDGKCNRAGNVEGHSSNLYYEGGILYSYGRHFPLLVRTHFGYILNADKYSSTTSQHQSMCRNIATIQVPFSALMALGLISGTRYLDDDDFDSIELVDKTEPRNDIIGYKRWIPEEGSLEGSNAKYEHITPAKWQAMPEIERETWSEVTERRPEGAVLKKDDIYYLSSMDGWNYFISLLPEAVETVDEAFESLKPYEVSKMVEHVENGYHRGVHYIDLRIGEYARQGEWFVTPATTFPISLVVEHKTLSPSVMAKRLYKAMLANFVLPKPDSSSNDHIATRGDIINGQIYVSGGIRHPEHQMLRLSKADSPRIFMAYRNRAINSWSAGGRVD